MCLQYVCACLSVYLFIYLFIGSNFKSFGLIKALGDQADPTLILVYSTAELLTRVEDRKKKRLLNKCID